MVLPSLAHAQAAPPAGHAEESFDFMNLMADEGLHDLDEESWNAYGQFTSFRGQKLAFSAPYTNLNNAGLGKSLLPTGELSYTDSLSLFLAVRLWKGAEAYFVPEAIAEVPLSGLTGLGGSIQDAELQKTGAPDLRLYRARTYVRQTIDLGGARQAMDSQPMQLGTVTGTRRLVFTVGNFSILDMFDKNSVTGDFRKNFFNISFMTHSSWDFASDARGYSWGGVAELFWDDWSARYGRITPPQTPNNLPVDFRLLKYFGDQVEVEHDHTIAGQAGAIRILGYRNQVDTAKFSDAINAFERDPLLYNALEATNTNCPGNYGSKNPSAPDLCAMRRMNVKLGIGIDMEQYLAKDVGVFFRAMYSDGQSEVDAFNSADRSLSVGARANGTLWKRPFDATGIGTSLAWISNIHAQYLAMGGVDGFVGDGRLHQGAEGVAEAFYSVNILSSIWLAADYQFIWNPGFNTDRGPVHVLGGRLHVDF